MPRRSKWPNKTMWRRGEELLKKGLSYRMIAGRLASEFSLEEIPSEDTVRKQIRNLASDPASSVKEESDPLLTTRSGIEARVEARYGEGAVIDKSTAGKILRRDLDQPSHEGSSDGQAGSFERDQELESHRRELYYFGQRFRDRLVLPAPHQVLTEWITASSEEEEPVLWSGRPAIPTRDPAEMSEEEWNVEEGWRGGPFNAGTHPLFPSFRDHLGEKICGGTSSHWRVKPGTTFEPVA